MPVFLSILWTISQSWLYDTSTLRGVPIKQGRGQMRCMEGGDKGVQHGQHPRSLRFRGCQDQPCAHTFPSYRLHQGGAGPAYVTLWLALSWPGGFQASGRSRNCQGTARTPRTDLFYSMASSPKQEAMGGKCAHTKLLCPLVLPGISARWCLGQDLLNGKPDEVVTMTQCHSLGGLFLRFWVCYSGVPGTVHMKTSSI